MTRRHFEAIARALRSTNASVKTCAAIAAELAGENVKFDHARFMLACGYVVTGLD